MFKSNKSTTNINETMLGKHDSGHQEPPFLSNNANKRLSFIDKGKSWARQLLKNSNKGLNVSQNSFESCDSGIDATSNYTRDSFDFKNSKFKVPQSSSCSFITSPYTCPSNNSGNNTESTCTLTTSKSTSFSSECSNSTSYDQVYSSTSNSSSAGSSYLVSPVDESGYLVPIITLTNRPSSFSEKRKPSLMNSNKNRKNRLSNLIPSCSPLTRSFSTRTAYNPNKPQSPYSSYNPGNRATICEQITVNDSTHCVKCNCKLNLKTTNSDGRISHGKCNDSKGNEQALNKYNQEFNLFESYTCASCISSDCNSRSDICKPPIAPAPLPPSSSSAAHFDSQQKHQPQQKPLPNPPLHTIPTNPAPPLPLLPPPTLPSSQVAESVQKTVLLLNNTIDQEKIKNLEDLVKSLKRLSINEEKLSTADKNIKITPLLLCTGQKETRILDNSEPGDLKLSTEQLIKKYTALTNKCLNELANHSKNPSPNSELKHKKSSETLEGIIKFFESYKTQDTNISAVKPKTNNRRTTSGSFTNDHIVYIDSADLEHISSSSSASISSSANSSNRSSLSNPNLNMNQLLTKLKQANANSAHAQTRKKVAVNPEYSRLSYHQPTSQTNHQQHDYHVIDDFISENQNCQRRPHNRLTPTNSLASFDFIDPKHTRLIKLDSTKNSYEKSWENSTVILLDKLNEKLASSLIAIANEQRKEFENTSSQPKNVKNCILREKKNNSQHQQQRISFPFQRASSQHFTSLSGSSGHHSFSSEHSPSASIPSSNTISSTSSIQSQSEQENLANSNGDDVEHLLSISSDEERQNLIKSYTNSSNNSEPYQYSYTTEIDGQDEAFNESWYQPNLPRENVQNCLANQEIGSFIIRLSNTCKNCYALSIRVPYFANQNGIAHYLITKNSRGYKLKGVEKEFKSLKSLVTHYSVMQEILPVTLNSLELSTTNSRTNTLVNITKQIKNNDNMACVY